MPYPMAAARGGPGKVIGASGPPPFTDDFNRANGALGNGWTGATWAIVDNKAVNTPALGSDLVVNGGFDADTNWTKGSGWTISGGVATKATNTPGGLSQANVLNLNQFHRLDYTLPTVTNSSLQTSALPVPRSAAGTYRETPFAANRTVGFAGTDNSGAGTVDNVAARALTTADLFAVQDFGSANVDMSVAIHTIQGIAAGLVVALDSLSNPQNYVLAYFTGTQVMLARFVAGARTSNVAIAWTTTPGDILRVTKSATTYRFFANGVQRGSNQTINVAAINNNTLHGLFAADPLAALENFSLAYL